VDEFLKNMQPVRDVASIQCIQGDSAAAANNFVDGSLEFVFIDANHEYEPIKADIKAWLPKVRKGGVLAGHDYGSDSYRPHPGVSKAVHELLGDDITSQEDCWMIEVK
jgi:predicted O-methyltransferase YrrM